MVIGRAHSGARAVHAHAVADAWWGMGEEGRAARLDVDKALVFARNLQRPQDDWCAHALTAFPRRAHATSPSPRANTQQRDDGVGKCGWGRDRRAAVVRGVGPAPAQAWLGAGVPAT